jgi:hypothetical protein
VIPCHGGPLDGEAHADVGLYFTTVAIVGSKPRPGWTSGYYERLADGYYWRS